MQPSPERQLAGRREESHAAAPKLEFLWIELTAQCNLECIHCYCNSSPRATTPSSLSLLQRKLLIDSAAKLGCRQIQFIGGEPTLSKDLVSLVGHAHSRDVAVEVFTNATHISADFLQCLSKHKVSVATSFYCDDAEVHDKITMSRGSHSRTVANIQRIVQAGLDLRVGLIAMQQNNHRLTETRAFLCSLGVKHIGVDEVRGLGRAERLSQNSKSEPDAIGELCGHCGDRRLAVTPDGVAYPCVMSRKWPLGSLLENDLDEIVRTPLLQSFRHALAKTTRRAHPMDVCVPDEEITPCWPANPPCYPDSPCSPKNPCWPNNPPCSPDRPPGCLPDHGPPPCTPTDKCMPQM
jgi:MoaA/NifB/PqqE/SkfB family radical SAM enzyme